jgi:hypothetical protein
MLHNQPGAKQIRLLLLARTMPQVLPYFNPYLAKNAASP